MLTFKCLAHVATLSDGLIVERRNHSAEKMGAT
jgi:hypothetical protein